MRFVPPNYQAFLADREIPREVEPPHLSDDDVTQVLDALFVAPELREADIHFIFGSSRMDYDSLAIPSLQGLVGLVVATGMLGSDYYATGRPQAHLIREALVERGVDENQILMEDRSNNTLENAVFTKALFEARSAFPRSILFSCKHPHSGRCMRTLRKVFPDTTLFCYPQQHMQNGILVDRSAWQDHPEVRPRLYAEYLRILRYSARGDIAA